jgi:hypothetical protein
MAKGNRNKSEAEPTPGGRSLLEVAWNAYEAGDAVLARRAAKRVLAGAASGADEALAKKISKQLFVGAGETDARQVAAELAARTRVAAKPYAFALLAAAIWWVMIALAHRG